MAKLKEPMRPMASVDAASWILPPRGATTDAVLRGCAEASWIGWGSATGYGNDLQELRSDARIDCTSTDCYFINHSNVGYVMDMWVNATPQ